MIFKKKEVVLNPFTLEQCSSCSAISKRQFKQGDYIFKAMEKCVSCKIGQTMIVRIFGESVK